MKNILEYFAILPVITISCNNCYSTAKHNSNCYNLTSKEYKTINKACDNIIFQYQNDGQNELENEFVKYLIENRYLLCEVFEYVIDFVEKCEDITMVCKYQEKDKHYNFNRLLKYTGSILNLYTRILNPIMFNRLVLNKEIPLSEENINIAKKISNQDIVNIFKEYEEQYKIKCNKLLKIIDKSLKFFDRIIEGVNSKRVSTIRRFPIPITDLLDIRKNLSDVKSLYYYSMCLNSYKDFIEESLEKISELKPKMYLNAI